MHTCWRHAPGCNQSQQSCLSLVLQALPAAQCHKPPARPNHPPTQARLLPSLPPQAQEMAAAKGVALPEDFAAAAAAGGLRRSVLEAYARLATSGALTAWLVKALPAFRDRLIRDRLFFFKVWAEVAIDSGEQMSWAAVHESWVDAPACSVRAWFIQQVGAATLAAALGGGRAAAWRCGAAVLNELARVGSLSHPRAPPLDEPCPVRMTPLSLAPARRLRHGGGAAQARRRVLV